MTSRRPCDVVVVGLGAAGGLAAALLARAGVQVVGLEAGARHSRADYPQDDVRHLGRNHLGAAKVNGEIPTARERPDQEAVRVPTFGGLMMNGVGGSKIHSTNISWRLLPYNFKTRSAAVARYGSGVVPAGSTIVDWPLDYNALAPFYDLVEQHYGVAGEAGANPHEGSRRIPFPHPPMRQSGWTEKMGSAARALGWSPFPTPASIRTVEGEDGAKPCQYCGFCTWNGCWVDAKGVPSSIGLPEAEASGNLQILTGARVTELVTDANGAAVGVRFVREGREELQPARRVVLASYTYENTRLLLLSRSKAFPQGLANNNGQVGRHFSTHSFLMGFGLFPGTLTNAWTGTAAQSAAVDEFDGDNFDHTGLGFIGGSVMMACHDFRPLLHHRFTPPGVARWGAERKRWLQENLASVGWAYTLPDFLPYEDDRIDLDPSTRDPFGLPVVRVTLRLRENERRQVEYLNERMREWMEAAGATQYWNSGIRAAPISTHAYGGTRMGEDPASSVVDSWGYAHEVPNLVIAGASLFPNGGGLNPTETVEALTWRTADRLVAELAREPTPAASAGVPAG